jgi:replication factor C subunit 2/4
MMQQPWIEKYRPTRLSEIVGLDDVKSQLIDMHSRNGFLPHIVLFGKPGIGKTTIFQCLVREFIPKDKLDDCVMEINASNDRGQKVIQTRLQTFVSNDTRGVRKYVILEELDNMTDAAQELLLAFFTRDCGTTFLCTCNDSSSVNEVIQSNSFFIKLTEPTVPNMKMYLDSILVREGLKASEAVVYGAIRQADGDMRVALNILQSLAYLSCLSSADWEQWVPVSQSLVNTTLEMCMRAETDALVLTRIEDALAASISPEDILFNCVKFVVSWFPQEHHLHLIDCMAPFFRQRSHYCNSELLVIALVATLRTEWKKIQAQI